jgi:hypothetical protein
MATTIQSAFVAGEAAPIVPAVRRGGRAQGAIVAAAVAIAATILGIVIGQVWGMALGIPAATVSGWWLAPRIRTDRAPIGVMFSMAALTIALADAMAVLGLFVGATIAGTGPAGGTGQFGELALLQLIGGAILFWLLGLILVGILSLLVVVPCAAAWAYIVRKLAQGNAT